MLSNSFITHAPLSTLEVPSGMYLISTFRRRYMINPYKGEGSSYLAMASRASDTPRLPLLSSSTESREVYFSRYLFTASQHAPSQMKLCARICVLLTNQPPASATVLWYASCTAGLSKPLSDILVLVRTLWWVCLDRGTPVPPL